MEGCFALRPRVESKPPLESLTMGLCRRCRALFAICDACREHLVISDDLRIIIVLIGANASVYVAVIVLQEFTLSSSDKH